MDAAVIVGIDVSKDLLDVHVLPEGTAFRIGRDDDDVSELIARIAPFGSNS